MGLRRACVGSNVTFYPQDTADKRRDQWICLAAEAIRSKMDSWTLLYVGFDGGEEADGHLGTAVPRRGVDGGEARRVGMLQGCKKRKKMRRYA